MKKLKKKLLKRKMTLNEISEDLECLNSSHAIEEKFIDQKNNASQLKEKSKENLDQFFPPRKNEIQNKGIISKIKNHFKRKEILKEILKEEFKDLLFESNKEERSPKSLGKNFSES
jgi:hypothetical protein